MMTRWHKRAFPALWLVITGLWSVCALIGVFEYQFSALTLIPPAVLAAAGALACRKWSFPLVAPRNDILCGTAHELHWASLQCTRPERGVYTP